MLERISVRKPFTVLVGVILILVLGVVSLFNTSTDLLPAMDLPFSAIITVYPGATPEQVERDISIPLEGRMSTLGGISSVQSISAEHMSFIIMEFTGSTNMDSASLEIREALDMMTLPDGAARPMTIRMNPEMMPILMTQIYMDGMEIDELSEFAINYISPAIEGIPGVAMVNLTGLVQNQLHVIIQQERIDYVNARLAEEVADVMAMMMAQTAAIMEAQATAAIAETVPPLVEAAAEEFIAEMQLAGMPLEMALAAWEEAAGDITAEITAYVAAAVQEEMAAAAYEQAAAAGEMPPVEIPAEMLSVETISGILFAQNFAMPAGVITDTDGEFMVRVGDRFETTEEIADMLIFDPGMLGLDMQPVRLSDVAHVFTTDDRHLSFTRVNNEYAIMMAVQRQSEFTTADIANAVLSRLDVLVDDHPGLSYAVLMDQGEMIGMVIGGVLNSLLWGGLLAIIVLFFFLKDWKPTLIVAVSIPVSLLLAFTLMYFTGMTLNMMSMGGLALTVGMLVDNSIVVIENIFRMRESTDRSPARAAISGARQVSGAIFAATVTTIAMFLPIVFTQGLTRQIFTDFGLTIAFALLASLIIALTVVPAMSSVMLKKVKPEGRLFHKFVDGYEAALRFALRWRFSVLLIAVFLFVGSIILVGRQGMEMFPPMDTGQISVTATMWEGATFEEMVQTAESFTDMLLRDVDGIETVGASTGGGMMAMMAGALGMGGMGGMGGVDATGFDMYILLEEGAALSDAEIVSHVRTIAAYLGIEAEIEGDQDMMMMMGEPISMRVEGRELDDIRDTAIALGNLIREVPGTIDVTDFAEDAAPEMRIIVDKDAAMAHGLTVAQVFLAAMSRISPPEESVYMTLNGRSYEIVISDGDWVAPDRETIENMLITTMAGAEIPLSFIAEVRDDIGFTAITRMNRNRFLNVTGNIAEGYNVTLVNNEIQRRIDEYFTPVAGTTIVTGGEAEAIADAFGDLVLMLALGLLFTYLIMVAQFQSLLSPFVIMFTIPLAFTGGFAGLLVVGMPLSIVAMVGLILLAGVAINNGIVLVSRITQMRWEGMEKREAIVDAGRKRIRPIIMTAVSTIFAMLFMAFALGDGMEMMQPMAIATIGGLLYCTVMTLFVVPIIYDLFHRNKDVTLESLDDEE
jgi:multidrug efflux pump subunit AcrB